MPDYVRAYVPGSSYERRRRLLTENIEALREAFGSVALDDRSGSMLSSYSPITSIAFGRYYRTIRIFQPAGA